MNVYRIVDEALTRSSVIIVALGAVIVFDVIAMIFTDIGEPVCESAIMSAMLMVMMVGLATPLARAARYRRWWAVPAAVTGALLSLGVGCFFGIVAATTRDYAPAPFALSSFLSCALGLCFAGAALQPRAARPKERGRAVAGSSKSVTVGVTVAGVLLGAVTCGIGLFREAKGGELVNAAMKGDVAAARRLVACWLTPLNSRRGDYLGTPLYYASRDGHPGVVRVLLEAGAQPNIAAKHGLSIPLCVAAGGGHREVVELLLRAGADPNQTSLAGTPLHWAIGSADKQIVRCLLANGASVSISVPDFGTPLQYAESTGHDEITALLRTHADERTGGTATPR